MILENKIHALFEEIGNSMILILEVGKYVQNFKHMFKCVKNIKKTFFQYCPG